LTTARSLRRCPVEIIGLFYSEDSICEKSNIWNDIVHVEKTTQDIICKLEDISRSSRSNIFLLPSDDESVKIVSDNRAIISKKYVYVLPDKEQIDLLLDKSKFQRWAEKNDFSAPKTRFVSNLLQLEEAIISLQYPVLLKPLYRNPEWDRHIPNAKVFILEKKSELKLLPEDLFSIAPTMLVQQWIPGDDDGIYFCLVYYDKNAELVDYFCGRKLMQWPPLGGSTAVAISDDKEETKEITLSIFNKIKYRGLGSVEYKKNPVDNKMYIMEPTVGRNDYQSYISVIGNVNLTEMGYCDVVGKEHSPAVRRKSIWFSESSTYYAIKYYIKKGNRYYIKHLPRIIRRAGFSLLSIHDLAPFIEFVKRYIAKIIYRNK